MPLSKLHLQPTLDYRSVVSLHSLTQCVIKVMTVGLVCGGECISNFPCTTAYNNLCLLYHHVLIMELKSSCCKSSRDNSVHVCIIVLMVSSYLTHICRVPPDRTFCCSSTSVKVEGRPHIKCLNVKLVSLALQENTDELLELAHTSTPKKALLHSDIKANLVRNKSTAGESHGVIGYNDEDEAYSDVRMNFNFTPAPQSHVKCDSHPNERAKLQKEDLQPNFDNFMTQLITLLQR